MFQPLDADPEIARRPILKQAEGALERSMFAGKHSADTVAEGSTRQIARRCSADLEVVCAQVGNRVFSSRKSCDLMPGGVHADDVAGLVEQHNRRAQGVER